MSEQTSDPRRQFIATHLAGLPTAYTDRLGADPAAWPREAEQLRQQHRLDFGKATPGELINAGLAGQDVPPVPQAPREPSPVELINQGLQQSTPARRP